MSRIPMNSIPGLAHLVIRMSEGFLIDNSSVSVPCSHCARYYFRSNTILFLFNFVQY
jgi:hypothetical protein